VPEEVIHHLRNGLLADVTPDFGGYLLRKHFFRVHLDRTQITVAGDNTYENRIITNNPSSPSRAAIPHSLKRSTLIHWKQASAVTKFGETNLLPIVL